MTVYYIKSAYAYERSGDLAHRFRLCTERAGKNVEMSASMRFRMAPTKPMTDSRGLRLSRSEEHGRGTHLPLYHDPIGYSNF